MKLPLPISTTERRVPNAVSRLVNMQAEQNAPDAKMPYRVYRAPGVRAWKTCGTGPGRGLYVFAGSLWAVSGNDLYRVGEASAGTIPGSGPVHMADDGVRLVIVTNPDAYVYTAGAVAQISDADFEGASDVAFVDGYFVFSSTSSGRWFCSNLYSTEFDPLKFAYCEVNPDFNSGQIIADHRQVIIPGTASIQLWWNSGAGNFPFDVVPDGVIELGCRGGMVKIDNSVIWAADDGTVRRLTGRTPLRVSNHGVEEAIARYTGIPRAFAYTLEGHMVYCVSWNEATWCFDVTTGTWFQRESFDGQPWRVCDVATLNGVVYAQDRTTGAVGILDPECYAEWGDRIVAEWTYPAICDGRRMIRHARLEVLAEAGVGLANGQGSAPQVMLHWSDDGAKEFKAFSARSLGAIGAYKDRVIWHRLGASRDRVYRCSVSDPVPVNVFDTVLDVG